MVGQKEDRAQSRAEIDFLGTKLGEVIRQFEGEEAFVVVEKLRLASRERRSGNDSREHALRELISTVDASQHRVVIRAFSVFLDLMNVVEDRTRVRVLADRARSRLALFAASAPCLARSLRSPSSKAQPQWTTPGSSL